MKPDPLDNKIRDEIITRFEEVISEANHLELAEFTQMLDREIRLSDTVLAEQGEE